MSPTITHPFLVIPIFGATGVGCSCAALVLCAFAFYIWIQSYWCSSCLFLSRYSVFAFMLSYSTKRSAIIRFFVASGWGVMNLVYGSSSSSYMDCLVFFGDECYISRRSGVRLTLCFCICASVEGLVIFRYSFCGSSTFRMSTSRLPILIFVSRIEYPIISCCFVARSACGDRRGLLLYMLTMACQ